MVEVYSTQQQPVEVKKLKKKSFIGRMSSRRSNKAVDSREDDTPLTREGIPVVSSISGQQKFNPSDVRNVNKVAKGRNHTKMVVLPAAPPAKVAAFEGPPRYDWIDVVSSLSLTIRMKFFLFLSLTWFNAWVCLPLLP